MRGKHAAAPSDDVLRAFSVVFPKLTLQKLRSLAGLPAGEVEPYRPPAEADRLGARQRRAVDELIRLLAETAGGEHGGRDTAPMNEVEDLASRRRNRRKEMQELAKKSARRDPDTE